VVYALQADGSITTDFTPDVVWVYRRHRRQWLEAWQRGDGSSEFLYALPALCDRYRTGFVEEQSSRAFLRAWYPVEWLIARRVGMGFALDLALRNLPALNRAKVLVSTVDTCGLPLALLKRVGLLKSRLVYISQGLSDRIAVLGTDRWLSRRYRRLLLAADELVTLSAGAGVALAAWLGIPTERVRVLPFGTDCGFWRSTSPPDAVGTRIVSVGSDAGRDYATLLAAVGDLPLHIVTRQPLRLDGRASIERTTDHSARELRDIYSGARFVVIPLAERSQPSGQSAALQAMACGRAVIHTRTGGWWGDPYLVDGDNCILVPPGQPAALGDAMRRLWSDTDLCRRLGQRARDTVAEHFAERHMAIALSATIAAHL